MYIQSTETKSQCEYCGVLTKNVHIVMGHHVRACTGLHAYKAHRQEKIIHQIFEGAFRRCEMQARATIKGQGLVEYALILALVSVVVIVVLAVLGPAVGNIFSHIVTTI